ncbi:hypothetical protein E0H92_08345 [Kribbella speibonae]|uniref:Uncharacterized protein n=1 Tax=Kribbella speibonae TaxID=1572660 RepID=A0A4R0J6H5_9ACTN|nr:hypothetical protein E0H92_08345 [Kribbella speibonae]
MGAAGTAAVRGVRVGRRGRAPAVAGRPGARHAGPAGHEASRTSGRSSLCRTTSEVTARVRQT